MATERTRAPISLKNEIEEPISAEDEPLDFNDEPTDRHVVCIVLTPDLKYVAWVFNLEYPAGKPKGWGIVGGRSENKGESVIDVAKREIWEETGIPKDKIEILEIVCQGWVHDKYRGSEYMRTILICVTRHPGNPKIQALAEDGTPQTREFRWFPLDKPPSMQELGESVYFKHTNTIPEALIVIDELKYSKHWPLIQEAKEEWDFNCAVR
ncbi:MAG: NUDIX domain-containing protein [Patescibacteria group bacterium]